MRKRLLLLCIIVLDAAAQPKWTVTRTMHEIDVKLKLSSTAPAPADLDRLGHWVILLSPDTGRPGRFPWADLLRERRRRIRDKPTDEEPLSTVLPNQAGTHVVFACVEAGIGEFELLTLAGKLAASSAGQRARELGIAVQGFSPRQSERLIEALLAAQLAAAAPMPSFKKEPPKPLLQHIYVYGCRPTHAFRRTLAEARGNALARWFSSLPGNSLTPADYLRELRRLARSRKWKLQFMGERELKRQGCGAFLAVAQGSPARDAGIVRLSYRPARARRRLVLVGKGICYDTGGTNLKPAKSMYGMHGDMEGSAVALGIFDALTRLKPGMGVECWMALAMNHIGPKAYKPNDVVTACDGTTIEIVHTDAEGRMVLADTLALATASKPDLLIDFATLTGACIYSLGNAYSGVFSNRDKWLRTLIETGRRSGERVWPFPMDEDYDQGLDSDIADIKQCAPGGEADHILAARFLQRFIKNDVPWVHMDLSAGMRKGGLAHIPTFMTGFGVRYTLSLLLDTQLLTKK